VAHQALALREDDRSSFFSERGSTLVHVEDAFYSREKSRTARTATRKSRRRRPIWPDVALSGGQGVATRNGGREQRLDAGCKLRCKPTVNQRFPRWLSVGAPEEIRTPDPQIRSLVLYPAELRARVLFTTRSEDPETASPIVSQARRGVKRANRLNALAHSGKHKAGDQAIPDQPDFEWKNARIFVPLSSRSVERGREGDLKARAAVKIIGLAGRKRD
jgi:hypothetical protein